MHLNISIVSPVEDVLGVRAEWWWVAFGFDVVDIERGILQLKNVVVECFAVSKRLHVVLSVLNFRDTVQGVRLKSISNFLGN